MNASRVHPWRFSYYAELAALPTTPYWARMLTRQELRTWGLDPFIETTALLVSELATNAVKVSGVAPVDRAAPLPTPAKLIAMRLSASYRTVIAEIWDSNPIDYAHRRVARHRRSQGLACRYRDQAHRVTAEGLRFRRSSRIS